MNELMRVRRRGWTFLAAVGLLWPAASGAQVTVTLDEAIQRAMDRSPTMAQQEQAVGNASSARLQALGAFIPNVSASSSGSLRSTQRFDAATDRIVEGSSDSYSAGLSGSITLFDGGRNFASYGGAQADYAAAMARRENQRNQVTLQTKNIFFKIRPEYVN